MEEGIKICFFFNVILILVFIMAFTLLLSFCLTHLFGFTYENNHRNQRKRDLSSDLILISCFTLSYLTSLGLISLSYTVGKIIIHLLQHCDKVLSI